MIRLLKLIVGFLCLSTLTNAALEEHYRARQLGVTGRHGSSDICPLCMREAGVI